MEPLLQTQLPGIPLVARGKVRDVYAIGDSMLLLVATDRISAFDCILGSGIPGKGKILTRMSLFWFDLFRDITPNHLVATEVDDYPESLRNFREQLEGRSMLVHRARMVDLECVARGYVSGSGWKEYQASQSICGISLPAGLAESSRLPEPIFTPAIKAQSGHDENISFARAVELAGEELASALRDRTLLLYRTAAEYALSRGIIIADTKFEFGFVDGTLVLADEVLTPDSSRFWPLDSYKPGGPQPSYDKQYVRDYLETLTWDKRPPAPALPQEVVDRTLAKYKEAYKVLTGKEV